MSGLGFARRSGRPGPVLRFDRARAQLSPWRGDPEVAHLVITPDAPLGPTEVGACVERARAEGYQGIVTSALNDRDSSSFAVHDFVIRERLHLLAVDLHEEPPQAAVTITRVRRREHEAVLALDAAAFTGSWRLGKVGLRDALDATPARQFRAARGDTHGAITGYAITGLAAPYGYLQRIATDPAVVRRGVGRALVTDGFRYLWRHGATRVFVNTQLDNAPALALYDSCGFELLSEGLSVLERTL